MIVFGIVIAMSATALLFMRQTPAKYAHIYKEGAGTVTVNLVEISDSYTIIVDHSSSPLNLEGFNELEIEHGQIRMLSSDCPDGTCIRQGWRSGGILPIVCLPNRVVVTFDDGSSDLDIDAVVW